MAPQIFTPYKLLRRPDKDALRSEFVGRSLESVRTPAFIIDRNVFAQNCAKMHKRSKEWGASFRAHVKTHKTAEGTRLQLVSEEGQTHAVVVSTILEAWGIVHDKLVEDKIVNDILYGLPIGVDKISDLSKLWQEIEPHGGIVRLLVDHPKQIEYLEEFEKGRDQLRRWSVFVKVHSGQNRAGLRPESEEFRHLVKKALTSPAINVYGFYGHAGNSYGSTSLSQATSYLSEEVMTVNKAAEIALDELSMLPNGSQATVPFVLSVGSTPTAHAVSGGIKKYLSDTLHGSLELHAGNYPMLDLQQQHTSLIENAQIAQRVRVNVISYYPRRGPNGEDEALVDGGAIAFSKDTGPSGGYGEVVGKPWKLSRISQEHGILVPTKDNLTADEKIAVGQTVDIVGQHACLIAAGYPWYYVVDARNEEIVDIWVPWKGW